MFQNNKFYLMNKDTEIAYFESLRDEYQDITFNMIDKYSQKLPIGFKDIGTWIVNRQAPKHRAHIESLLRSCGCYDLDGYIRITHALTLNDTFWVKPTDSDLKWQDVSLFCNEFDETIAHIAFEGGLYGEQFTTTSPEFGTDGAYAKCWIREENDIYLLKRGSSGARNAGLEPYSEMYSAQLAKMICPDHVDYNVVKYRGKLSSKCKLFTSENYGFTPIHRCVEEHAGVSKLMKYYAEIGSEDAFRRMIVLDAVILNTDRHRGNFGILFDNDTLEPVKMAPVFDHNQALLPYAEEEDFKKENIEEYLAGRPVRIGNDFNEIAHSLLTPAITADLKNMRGFQFDRNTVYSLPEERLKELENIVNMQINNVLQDKHLYISQSDSEKKTEMSYMEKYKKKVVERNNSLGIDLANDLER